MSSSVWAAGLVISHIRLLAGVQSIEFHESAKFHKLQIIMQCCFRVPVYDVATSIAGISIYNFTHPI